MPTTLHPISNPEPQASTVIFRIAKVVQITGLSRSTIYREISESRFPQPVRLTKRAVGWRQNDLERWSASRLTGIH